MIELNREYYSSPYYFFLKQKGENIDVYFSVETTLNEARIKDEKVTVPLKKEKELKNTISKIAKNKKKRFKKDDIKKEIEKINTSGEIDEFVDFDGSIANSKIPLLQWRDHPIKTMDQTVASTRTPGNPLWTGFYRYFGESVEINETDLSDAYGYEECSGKTGPWCLKWFKEQGVEPDEALERVRAFGMDPYGKKKKDTLSEIQRKKMIGVLEDMLAKKTDDKEIGKTELKASNILKKNAQSLKRMAEKEGLSLKELVELLKNEQWVV